MKARSLYECRLRLNRLGQELRNAFPEAIISFPPGLELGLTCDRKDRNVLAAAISGQCSLIVTSFVTCLTLIVVRWLGAWNELP